MQASPNDRDTFPFVVLGNKIDQDEGRSRTVRWPFAFVIHTTLLYGRINNKVLPAFTACQLLDMHKFIFELSFKSVSHGM